VKTDLSPLTVDNDSRNRTPVRLGLELPLAEPVRERADAARNREKVLAAAERLFRERGTENVSMDDVAEAAGVGKGTLYRGFGDRAGLAHALLDARETAFQEACIRGEPPLGPGADPVERLVAFGRRVLELWEETGDLKLAAETGPPGTRAAHPVFQFYGTHLRLLVSQLDPELDADYFAEVLLATLSAESVWILRRGRAMSRERVAAGWESLVRALTRGR
jgi:AcrR family transcriptional regulator